jgi:hypothetical protein
MSGTIILIKINDMRTFFAEPYNQTKRIVKELNAVVYTLTFDNLFNKQKADLYFSPNGCNVIVKHGTTAPACCSFVETIILKFATY